MKMNKLALACGVALLGSAAVAQAEFSANIGATSNYMFRGVTLSNDQAAVSGGLDWAHDSGFYLGTWTSNIEGLGNIELDLYGGFGGEMGDLGYDVGYVYYAYPNAEGDADYGELYGSLSWKFLSGGLAYTTNAEADEGPYTEGDLYAHIGASFDLPQGFTAGLTFGYTWFDDDGLDGGDFDYAHYQLDIGKSAGDFGDFTFSLSLADDTDVSDDDLRPFVSWSKSF
jgi:uncharacterized protein (TIGR02001 family)